MSSTPRQTAHNRIEAETLIARYAQDVPYTSVHASQEHETTVRTPLVHVWGSRYHGLYCTRSDGRPGEAVLLVEVKP